ncbi:MAG: hypothetical protein JO293_03545 [Candidatus Eremiobacteraeota bacterium]|nr:hypothetical protein [Candidatus Eremiobacteraeota bacterium]
MQKIIITALSLTILAIMAADARAASDPPKAWQDVRALVVRFNDAQNVHNIDVSGALLLNSPEVSLTAGPVLAVGHDAAVNALVRAYAGDWRVLPDYGRLSIQLTSPTQADVSVPVEFKTAAPGQDITTTESMVRERAVLTPDGWRLASIAIDPAPAAISTL